MRIVSRPLSFVLLLVSACGASPSPGSTGPASAPGEGVADPAAPPSAVASFDLHEWGLIDVAANGSAELAAGPGSPASIPEPTPDRPIHVRKPVLYAHLVDGAASVAFALRADVPGGRIVESWPEAAVSGGSIRWSSLEVRTCGATRRAPSRDASSACASLDGVCEVVELPRYAARDADCLFADSRALAHDLLFYRADLPRLALPISVSRRADRSLEVRAEAAIADASLVRIVRDRGQLRVVHVERPAAGESQSIPLPVDLVDPRAESARLHDTVVSLGLSPGEAQAFVDAWSSELFDSHATHAGTPALDDVLLYFLAEPTIEGIAPINAAPRPRELRRVWLVRVEIPR